MRRRTLESMLVKAAAVVCDLGLAWLCLGVVGWLAPGRGVLLALLPMAYLHGLYDMLGDVRRRHGLARGALLTGTLSVLLGTWSIGWVDPAAWLVPAAACAFLLTMGLIGLRQLAFALVPTPIRRALVVGTDAGAQRVIEAIQRSPDLILVGILTRAGETHEGQLAGQPVVGTVADLPTVVALEAVDEIIVSPGDSWRDELMLDVTAAAGSARVLLAPAIYDLLIGRPRRISLQELPLVEISQTDRPSTTIGRWLDVVAALWLTILLAPLMVLIAAAIRVLHGRPVLYTQTRLGLGCKPFEMIKFRTMCVDAEKHTGPVLATPGDPRVTPLGRLLRATGLDELPQLWNILRGDMRFVGPRPERPHFVEAHLRDIPGYAMRFRVPPGVTGLAQVHVAYDTPAAIKLQYDLAYVVERSLGRDALIILATIKRLLGVRPSFPTLPESSAGTPSPRDRARREPGR